MNTQLGCAADTSLLILTLCYALVAIVAYCASITLMCTLNKRAGVSVVHTWRPHNQFGSRSTSYVPPRLHAFMVTFGLKSTYPRFPFFLLHTFHFLHIHVDAKVSFAVLKKRISSVFMPEIFSISCLQRLLVCLRQE